MPGSGMMVCIDHSTTTLREGTNPALVQRNFEQGHEERSEQLWMYAGCAWQC